MDNEMVIKIDEVEIYDNDFEIAIAEACDKYGIEELEKASQRRWKKVMEYVGKRVFKDNKMLRSKDLVMLEGNKIPTNNNRFNYDAINVLCDFYMSLSDQYDKLISAEAFSLFLNVPRDTIGSWKDEEPSTTRFHIYKKLKDFRLECIKDKACDNGNVTGTIAVGNWEFGLNMPGIREEKPKSRLISREEMGLEAPKERPALPGTGGEV